MALQRVLQRMELILRRLKIAYPDAHCSLTYHSPFQLLVATILSAQCTDERVNRVTPTLFARFPGAFEMARAPLSEIESLVHSTGFFRSKALSILEVAQTVVREYAGQVPSQREALIQMRGVGRKTANVVLGEVFGQPSLVVDTHVGRLSRRMGFTQQKNPEKVETVMMRIVPQKDWTLYAHLLIQHGRQVCTARKARCSECIIQDLCQKVGVLL